MFAGEGGPGAHQCALPLRLSKRHSPAKRLSHGVRFSVTLYGEDPDRSPGHLRQGRGTRACRSARCDDMRRSSIRASTWCDPNDISVSMTINGPAPMLLAFFMNAGDRPAMRALVPQEHGRSASRDKRQRVFRENGVMTPPIGDLPEAVKRRQRDDVAPGESAVIEVVLPIATRDRMQGRTLSRMVRGPSRPTSSRRTRHRTPASSRPSSRCG